MDYAIILLFDNASDENINKMIFNISKETGNNYMIDNKIPSHLSISLFKYDKAIDEIIGKIENNKNKFNKNSIFISSIGIFNPNVLFLSPVFNEYLTKENKKIIEIINELENITFDKYYIENSWVPHISLGVKLNENELINGIKMLSKCFKPMCIEINRLGLVECNPYKEIKIWEL
jgi:hypothetical protein